MEHPLVNRDEKIQDKWPGTPGEGVTEGTLEEHTQPWHEMMIHIPKVFRLP